MEIFNISYILLAIVVPLAVSVILHEVSHGYIANMKGDNSAKRLGRLTLNPIAHIDLVGTIILPISLFYLVGFAFGYAKPVPINITNFKNPKQDMALVAAAGPFMNILLAVIAAILYKSVVSLDATILQEFNYFLQDSSVSLSHPVFILLLSALYFMVVINIILAVINLIPIPPADGSRIFAWALPDDLAEQYSKIEPYGIFLLLGLFIFNPFHIVDYTIRPIIAWAAYILFL
ncbi:MAG: site-2 protease family protein [Nitrospinota bacterium]